MPITVSWNGATANWNVSADWSDGIVPNDPGTDVSLGGAAAYTVTVSTGESFTIGSLTIADAAAVLSLRNRATLTTTGTFGAAGTLDVDNQGGDGGSSLSIGDVLSNSGTVNIGNTGLSAATTVTATGLSNTGTVNLDGGTGSAAKRATLDDTGAAPATLGNINIVGDALLEFGSGAVTGLAAGTTFSLRDDATPISLNAGGATTGTFGNAGTLDVDNQNGFSSDGGSSLAIGATLANSGTVNIGNNADSFDSGLSAPTTVSASGLSNTGTINLEGGTGGNTNQATLDDTGAAPATLGNINIAGDALLEFASGAVTGIANGTTFLLRDDPTPIALNAGGNSSGTFGAAGTLDVDNQGGDGGSSLSIGDVLSNSGTVNIGNTGLSAATTVTATGLSNTGTVNLDGGTGSTAKRATLDDTGAAPATLGNINIVGDALLEFGSGAVTGIANGTTFSLRDDATPISLNASGATTGTFGNAGTLDVDNQNGFSSDGGSSLAIGATLANSGTVNIGNNADSFDSGLSAPTTVSASGLSNTGTINLEGGTGGNTNQATLDDTGAAPATLGNINIVGDALLEFASGAVTGIANGTTFLLRDDPTPIALNAGGNSSGTFGAAGTLDVDNQGGDGGSSLSIGDVLSNSGTVNIGNTGLSAATTVTATGLSNTGTVNLDGGTGSAAKRATLDDTGAAPATLGNINIVGDALLEFGSGAVTGLAAGTTFSLRDDATPISLNAGGATTGTFGNAGTLDVDNQNGFSSDGGSSLAIGATLANSGTVNIGNNADSFDSGLSAPTTVSASGLSNSGTINLEGGTGGNTNQATLTINGAVTTSGTITLNGASELVISPSDAFTETAGTVTVNTGGTLAASTIDVAGGVLDLTSAITPTNGTGNFEIGGNGIVEFGGAVDSGHTIAFVSTAGTMELAAPAQFAPTIDAFAVGDKIDLLHTAVTGLSFANGVLTVNNGSTTVASLNIAGDYTTADFIFASDSHGGTDIGLSENPPMLRIAGPALVDLGVGQVQTISGVSLSEAGSTASETFTVTATDASGALSATGSGVSGNGTTSLTINGSFSQVNSDLATLTDTESAAGPDTITLNASDSLGNDASPQTIAVTVNGVPVITAPASATVDEGQATAISGVSLAESGNTAGETFTVTATDASGALSATGSGVSGNGTTSLTIDGSLSQVNGDLATLTDTESAAGPDTITLNASDSFGNDASPQTTAVTVRAPTVINSVSWNNATQNVVISGSGFGTQSPYDGDSQFLELSDQEEGPSDTGWGAGHVGLGEDDLVTVNVASWTDTEIVISGFTGSYGSNNWVYLPGDEVIIGVANASGAAPQSNAVFTRFTETVPGLPSPPAITAASTAVTVGKGQAAAIPGVSLSEAGSTASETFTVTLADTSGALSANGSGVSGNGSTSLTINGSLSQANSDLATLTDTESAAGPDTITLNASDSLGNDASPQTIAVTVNGVPVISAPASATVGEGQATAISGVSLAESGNTAGETFTVTATDASGALSATGSGVSGNGTMSLTIDGSLNQVNGDLATLTDTEGAAGPDTITLNAKDSLGNSAASQTIAVSTTAPPPAPSGLSLDPSTDSGVQGDDITDFTQPEIDGQGQAGDTVDLHDGSTLVGNGTVGSNGTWQIATTPLALGQHILTATETDTNGDTSVASAPLVVTIDATPTPVTATLSAHYFEVGASADPPDFGGSGTPNVALGSALGPNGFPVVSAPFGISDVDPSTDEITWWSPTLNSAVVSTGTGVISLPFSSNMFAPNSTGTNDAAFFETAFFTGTFNLSSSEAVEFQLGSDDDSFIYVDGVLLGENPGIHGVTNVNFTSNVLPAGANSIEVFYDDREATGAFLSLNILTSGVVVTPLLPVITAPGAVTVGGGQAADISGVSLAESGSIAGETFTVSLSDTNGALAATGSGLSGSGTVSLTVTGSLADVNAALATLTDTESKAGSDTITLNAQDSLGNAAVQQNIAVNVNLPPPAPSALTLDPSTDSGIQGDDITDVTQVEIDGQGQAGDTVGLHDGSTLVGTGTVGSNGTWQITTPTLALGPHGLTATETDGNGGDTSTASSALNLTIVAPPPAPSGVALDRSTDSGIQGDDITDFTQPKIDGQGQTGDTVDLYDGTMLVGSGTVGSNGAWQITTSSLAPGRHSLTATETDTVGDTSAASLPLVVTIDTATPPAPTGLTLDPSSAPGTANDAVTADTTPQIDGEGTAGDTVTLYEGGTVMGTGIVGSGGNWSIITGTLAAGEHAFTATETDPTGNVSAPSAPYDVTIVTQSIGPEQVGLRAASNALIVGSSGANDLLAAIGNHDTLIGGSGNDDITLFGQDGLIDGGAGANTIFVFGGNDTVTGGGGDNQIYIDSNDILTDGPAVFHDTVSSFSEPSGDRIHLTSDTVADALAHASTANSGQDTLITLSDGSTILLKGVSQINSTFFS